MKHLCIATALSLSTLSSAWAQVTVTQAWVRATVAEQKTSAAYLHITSKRAARLIDVRSSVAGLAEIHEMKMDGDVMRMRAVPAVDLPAGQTVQLAPGGHHVMLMDLKHALKAGSTVPITLVIEGADHQRETLEVQAVVRSAQAAHPH